MSEEGGYVFVDYETWKKRMQEIIDYSRRLLLYYMTMLGQAQEKLSADYELEDEEGGLESIINQAMLQYYKNAFKEALETYIYNLDMLNKAEVFKDVYIFALDGYGNPVVLLNSQLYKRFKNQGGGLYV